MKKQAKRASFNARKRTERWVKRMHKKHRGVTPGYKGCAPHGITIDGVRYGRGIIMVLPKGEEGAAE